MKLRDENKNNNNNENEKQNEKQKLIEIENRGRNENIEFGNGEEPEFADIFKKQAAADHSAGIESVKNIEYCKIAFNRRKKPFVSFYYYLCAFLVIFIIFMSYNISRIAGERLASETPRTNYEYSYESGDLGEKSAPAFYDKYRDPFAVFFFFAVEGFVLFVILTAAAILFRFAFLRLSGAWKKPGVLFFF